jgi:hypothetical protein
MAPAVLADPGTTEVLKRLLLRAVLAEFCVGCLLTGYHCSTTVQNHLSDASKYCYTLSDAFRTLRPSSGCLCEQH